jgi:hypothetical protein
VRDPENKPAEELSPLTWGRNTSKFAPILTQRVVGARRQWVIASPALGVYAFSRHLLCKDDEKMILIEFLSARNDVEDQQSRSSVKYRVEKKS